MGGEHVSQRKTVGKTLLQALQYFIGKSFLLQGIDGDARSPFERAVPYTEVHDLLGLLCCVSQPLQRTRDRLVDDLEGPTPGQLFEFDKSEVRFDPRCIAIHHQPYCSRWGYGRYLSVSVAVLLAELEGPVPRSSSRIQKVLRAESRIQSLGDNTEPLVLLRRAVVCGSPVIAYDTEHAVSVMLVFWKGTQYLGHLGGGGVRLP